MDTYGPACVSTSVVVNTDSVVNVGESTSSLFIPSCCFLMTAHVCPFIYPFHFIKGHYWLVWLLSIGQRFLGHSVVSVPQFLILRRCSLNLLKPFFSTCLVMVIWSMRRSLYSLVLFIIILSALMCIFLLS